MSSIKCILVDDEKHALSTLTQLISHFTPQLEILGSFTEIHSAYDRISEGDIQLIFLDIEMPKGSGFELLEKLQDQPVKTIFTTAYDKYAIRALKMSALDYLLKPVDPQLLQEAVQKIIKVSKSDHRIQQSHLVNGFNANKPHRLIIPTRTTLVMLELDHIIRLEAEDNYTRIFSESNEKPLLVAKTLRHFEKTLNGNQFIRVHQSHLVNMDKIITYARIDGGILSLTNGDSVPVSKSRRAEIKDTLFKNNLSLI